MMTMGDEMNTEQDNVNLPAFPTMLRKMWSGGEVQQWINENIKPLINAAAPSPVAQDEREQFEKVAAHDGYSLERTPDGYGDILTSCFWRGWLARARAATPAQDKQDTADHDEAVRLLGLVFDAWENGDPCHEDGEEDGAYLGMAFRLDDEVFHACCNLLNRLNPPRNASPTPLPAGSQQEAVDAARYQGIRQMNCAHNNLTPEEFDLDIDAVLAEYAAMQAQGERG